MQRFSQSWCKEADDVSELSKLLKDHPRNTLLYIGVSKASSNDCPPSTSADAVGQQGVVIFPIPSGDTKGKKQLKHLSQTPSSMPELAHPNQTPSWACIPLNYINNTKIFFKDARSIIFSNTHQCVRQ